MLINYIYQNFLKHNIKIIIIYVIVNLIIYPIEALGLSRLYSSLISKSKEIKTLKIPNFKNILSKKSFNNPSIESLIIYILVVLLSLSCIERVRNYIYAEFNPKFKMWIRNEIFKKTIDKYNTNFKDLKIGKEILRLEDIVFTIKEVFHFSVTNLLSLIIISLIIFVYLLNINVNVGLILVVYIITFILAILFMYEKIKIKVFERVDKYFKVGNNIDNSFTNLSNILSNNKNNYEKKKNESYAEEYKNKSRKADILNGNLIWLIRIINITAFIIIIGYSYNLFIKKKINNINFTTLIIIMIYYLGVISNQGLNIIIYLDRLAQIKYQEKYLKDLLSSNNNILAKKNSITKGKIEIKNLTYKYPKSNKIVLKNLNFTIQPKQKVAILGKSGSGKSTLMKLLIKFYKPQKGKILIDNTNIENIDTSYLRDNITYINQNTLLFDEDIYYNIKYGSKQSLNQESIAPAPSPNLQPFTNLTPSPSNKVYPKEEIIQDSKIEEILKKYDLLNVYDKLENKLRTKAGPRGTKLSLGMQKVTITLRGILRESKIIVLDEPLSGLDQLTRQKIIKLIINETKNKTVIVITHDKEILPHMDKTINLQEINNSKNQ